MKFRKLPLISLLALGSISLSSCFIEIVDNNETNNENQNNTDIQIDGSYYEGYNMKLKGGQLASVLQKQCFDKHTKWITYGQVNSYFSKTSTRDSVEAIAAGSDKNQWFYTGKEAKGVGTREHVWPCANSGELWSHSGSNSDIHYVDNSAYFGGGSDLYHIRTANTNVNTARGNSKFVDFDDPEFSNVTDTMEYGENGGLYTIKISGYSLTKAGIPQYANKCEPADEMKGDIARILAYVWVHYAKRGDTPQGKAKSGSKTLDYSDLVGTLTFNNIMGYGSDEKAKQVLADWNRLDPPSEVEKLRNNTVQKIQGNRNPFVDYPNLMDNLFNIQR